MGSRTRREGAGGGASAPRVRTRFGPQPVALLPLLLVLVGSLPAAATWPALSWVPLLPVAAAVWVLRARVRVTPEGLEACNGLRRHWVPWERVEGFHVPRRGLVRLLHDGRRTPLTAVPRRDAGRLVRAAEHVAGPAASAGTPT